MKLIISFIMLSLTLNICHGRDLRGTIVNDENEGLPYSIVKIPHKKIAVMTDSMGSFALPIDRVDATDSLEISYFGYQNKRMSVEQYMNLTNDSIVLVRLPMALPEVVAQPKKYKKKTVGKQHSWGMFKMMLGDLPVKGWGNGYEFHARDNKRYLLDKVGFYYIDREDRMTEMKFRIMIYDMGNVHSDPTMDFVSILSNPIDFTYRYNPADKGKFVFSVPETVVLPKDGMVEITFLEEMNEGELLIFKSNITGKSSWSKELDDGYQYWLKQPFAMPFFVECVEVADE